MFRARAQERVSAVRLALLERRVRAVSQARSAGRATTPTVSAVPVLPAVLELVRRGHRGRAIRLHRRLTGAGLQESKQAVDQAADQAVDDQH